MISVIEQQPAGARTDLVAQVEEIFSPSGILSKAGNFEFRPQQQEMAVAVARLIAQVQGVGDHRVDDGYEVRSLSGHEFACSSASYPVDSAEDSPEGGGGSEGALVGFSKAVPGPGALKRLFDLRGAQQGADQTDGPNRTSNKEVATMSSTVKLSRGLWDRSESESKPSKVARAKPRCGSNRHRQVCPRTAP